MKINPDALLAVAREAGDKLQATVNQTAQDTADQDIDRACHTLQERLSAIGINVELDWCEPVLGGLRRGDNVEIRVQ